MASCFDPLDALLILCVPGPASTHLCSEVADNGNSFTPTELTRTSGQKIAAGADHGSVSVPLMRVHQEQIAVLHVNSDAVFGEAEPSSRVRARSSYGQTGEALVQVPLVGVD